MQIQFQLRSYIHGCISETDSPANLQDLIFTYFGGNNHRQHKLVNVGNKSCKFAKECDSFVYAWM